MKQHKSLQSSTVIGKRKEVLTGSHVICEDVTVSSVWDVSGKKE